MPSHKDCQNVDPLCIFEEIKRRKNGNDSIIPKYVDTEKKFFDKMQTLAVPKCVSMWKNKKGYMVSLESRINQSSTQRPLKVNFKNFQRFNEALDRFEKDLDIEN